MFHLQVTKFQPPHTVKKYFTSAFEAFYTLLFYKNIVYENTQVQIGQNIKNILRISPASVLAIVFCFWGVFFKDFLDQ